MKKTIAILQLEPSVQFFGGVETSVGEVLVIPELKSNYGASMQTLYESNRPTMSVYKYDKNGGINYDPLIIFDDLIIQSVIESTRERTQMVMSSSSEKIYAFGREHRLYNVTAKLLDTDLDKTLTVADQSWDGQGLKSWRNFYRNYARISVCAKNNWIVLLTYDARLLYGAIIQNTRAINSQDPHSVDVSFLFYAVLVEGLVNRSEGDFSI